MVTTSRRAETILRAPLKDISTVAGRVRYPEDFDQKYMNEEYFQPRVAAVVTVPLDVVTDAIVDSNRIKPTVPTLPGYPPYQLDHKVYEKVFDLAMPKSPPDWIVRERRRGPYIAGFNLISKLTSRKPAEVSQFEIMPLLIGMQLHVHENDTPVERLQDILKYLWKTAPDSSYRTAQTRYTQLTNFFLSEYKLLEFFTLWRERAGVQLILGSHVGNKLKFGSWLKQAQLSRPPDAPPGQVHIHTPIPDEFVLAILPIGQYETSALRTDTLNPIYLPRRRHS